MFNELRNSSDVFVIAEVGQNHQGNFDLAAELIRTFAASGASAIKFQTRDNRYLLSEEAFEKAYESENAFASTYGAHREALELDPDWLPKLKEECHRNDVLFMSTAFDEPSLDLLASVGVDAVKIASFDAGNLPFIERVAQTGFPVVLSTGGAKWEQISNSVEALAQSSDKAVLHCVSEYPCDASRLGLEKISKIGMSFPHVAPGLSDHYNGTLSGPIAFLMGARVFEKHVTLNRAWKGTDHSFSLEPEGFRKFVRDLKRTPKMLPALDDDEIGDEFVFRKLGKSITAGHDLSAGKEISAGDLSGRIFVEPGIPVRQSGEVIGRKLSNGVRRGEKIRWTDLT